MFWAPSYGGVPCGVKRPCSFVSHGRTSRAQRSSIPHHRIELRIMSEGRPAFNIAGLRRRRVGRADEALRVPLEK